MESSTARKIEEKSPHDKIREKFQLLLDAMEQHIKLHPGKYVSADSDRLQCVKTLANLVYLYYDKPKLIDTFEDKLKTYLDKRAQNEKAEKDEKEDLNSFVILPKLSTVFTAPTMPLALHSFHDIMVKAMQEAAQINKTTWLGSDLNEKIKAVAAGHEIIAQELASNVYLAIFSGQLKSDDVLKGAVTYAHYMRECLTENTIYRADRSNKSIVALPRTGTSQKSYQFIFCANSGDAMHYLTSNKFYSGCCFGAEFSFQLVKEKPTDAGQFIPLLSTVKQMDVWDPEIAQAPKVCRLKYDAESNEFMITIDQRLAYNNKH